MRRIAVFLALLSGCSSTSDIVGVEDLGDADLRVVVARTERAAEVRLLETRTAYRYELEALSEVFERGDHLRVYVFGFESEDLTRAFPSFAGSDAADLAARLVPSLEADAPGVFGPPVPTRVLSAMIDDDSDAEIDYAPMDWDAARALADARFGFQLAGDAACPPVDEPFRVWRRDRPQSTCVYQRNSACEWTRADGSNCGNAVAVFGAEALVRQHPDGRITVGDRDCPPTTAQAAPPRLGESSAWDCGQFTVSAQEPTAFGVGREASIESTEVGLPSTYAAGRPGLYFGVDGGTDALLRRVSVEAGLASFLNIEAPILDRPTADDRPAQSADGQTVELVRGNFATVVGNAPGGQCFRTILDGRQDRAATIRTKSGATTLELADGLGGMLAETTDWQVVGDPGSEFASSPVNSELLLPAALGELERVTVRRRTDPITLVAHGSTGTYVTEQITRFPNDLNIFGCARAIAHPTGLAGDIVIGSNGIYALVDNGVAVLGDDGAELSRFPSDGTTYDNTHRITAARAGTAPERIVVDDRVGNVWLYDSATGDRTRVEIDGTVIAVVDGPRIVYRPSRSSFEWIVRTLDGTETTYVIPPLNEVASAPIDGSPEAVFETTGRTFIGYTAHREAGVLELSTGLSTAVPLAEGAIVRAVFNDDSGQEIWFAVQSATKLSLVEVVLPP